MNFCGLKRIKTIVDTWISGVSVSWAIELILVFAFLYSITSELKQIFLNL